MRNAQLFKEVMSRFPTGVTVVTGADASGVPVGFTANAVASVSLKPHLILVCADRGLESLHVLLRTGRFAVSVLRAEDAKIAHRFSEEIRDRRFQEMELVNTRVGPPTLKNALAWMDCRIWKKVEAGDHLVLIGEVVDCGAGPARHPLVFFGRKFGTVADSPKG